jgi:uncharacterized Zn finger protein
MPAAVSVSPDLKSRFDVSALKASAGSSVFARGAAYQREGRAQILAAGPDQILAVVAGTENYRVELTGRDGELGGQCTCGAFQDVGLCKHMVAAALAFNERNRGERAGANPLAHIREHLRDKGLDALVELVMGLAERDPALLHRLDVAAASIKADETVLRRKLIAAIDQAARIRGDAEHARAAGWASRIDDTLDAIEALLSSPRATLAIELAEHAIRRIEETLNEIDDWSGFCSERLDRAAAIHAAAVQKTKPEPVGLARKLFQFEMESKTIAFRGAAEVYADALGEQGLAEFQRLARAAYAVSPSPGLDGSEVRLKTHRLIGALDYFARRDGDLDARIALRARDLSSPWAYVSLAEFCQAQGREDQALRWAEEGLSTFADGRTDERLVELAAALLTKAGRLKEAEARLWGAFEKAPSEQLYRKLHAMAGSGARVRAERILRDRVQQESLSQSEWPADLLIRVLTIAQAYDSAWEAVRDFGASPEVKESLARESETSHPDEALAAYREQVEQLVGSGGRAQYAEAASLISHMGTLCGQKVQSVYLAELQTGYARRRA